jgi:hypothetical protein
MEKGADAITATMGSFKQVLRQEFIGRGRFRYPCRNEMGRAISAAVVQIRSAFCKYCEKSISPVSNTVVR